MAQGHSHSSEDAAIKYHEDKHLGEDKFHLHTSGLASVHSIRIVFFMQFCVLVYFLLCLAHFVGFALLKPRIRGSNRQLSCIRLKYFCIWVPIVILMVTLQAVSFYLTIQMAYYNAYWLAELNSIKQYYKCTNESLFVNVPLLQSVYETGPESQNIFGI